MKKILIIIITSMSSRKGCYPQTAPERPNAEHSKCALCASIEHIQRIVSTLTDETLEREVETSTAALPRLRRASSITTRGKYFTCRIVNGSTHVRVAWQHLKHSFGRRMRQRTRIQEPQANEGALPKMKPTMV